MRGSALIFIYGDVFHHDDDNLRNVRCNCHLIIRVMRKPTVWFPTWSNTNKAVQPQKMDRGLEFQISKVEGSYYT